VYRPQVGMRAKLSGRPAPHNPNQAHGGHAEHYT
jgi:hypothetical protein